MTTALQKVSRYAVLSAIGMFTAAGTGSCGGGKPAEEFILPDQLSVKNPTAGTFDCGALEQTLEGSMRTPATGEAAVRNSLSLLLYLDDSQKVVGRAVAFQIDYAGYFVTAAHNVTAPQGILRQSGINLARIIAFNLTTQEATFARSAVYDDRKDIGIVYAPNGRKNTPTPGIALAADEPSVGTNLTMVTVTPSSRDGFKLAHRTGTLIGVNIGNEPQQYGINQLKVEGMIPEGGLSGSPVITGTGSVVAIESGVYGRQRFEDYKGAYVSPVRTLQELVKRCDVHSAIRT